MSRTPLAVTMGDPAGIGPEVVLRALSDRDGRRPLRAVVFGDLATLREAGARLRPRVGVVAHEWCAPLPRHEIPVFQTSALPARARKPGRATVEGGDAAHAAVLAAVAAVQEGRASALVTAPLSKANVAAAGHRDFAGHTDLLADLAGARQVRMMMAGPRLRVVLCTAHVAIARVPRLITARLVLDTIVITRDALRRDFGLRAPRLAVCGLNPHAGEAGLFGTEDKRAIAPAVAAARKRRIDAQGPLPADTVFAQAVGGRYDAVVCMYHDQGLAPFKLLHFADGVNVTLGLPFVRTSPDHGTAYDIAGRNEADPRSMIAALVLANTLAARREELG